jgi:FPC/CPF motif-containing protein YcgG/quercetin dioxygenase-like cupin family protein
MHAYSNSAASAPDATRPPATLPTLADRRGDAHSRLYHPADDPDGSWQSLAATLFRERMLDRAQPFPCVFGVDAVRKGSLRFSFIPLGSLRTTTLAQSLVEFLQVAEELGNRTSLVCFFEPDPGMTTVADYERHFWELLRGLSDSDEAEWPEGVDEDPESPTWEFSFAGMPLFVVANTPAHRKRRSRYFEYFAVTFQPRFVFDGLAPDSPQGRNARRIIRRRLAEYDAVPQTPHLGNFGDADNREWLQYYLDDNNAPVPASAKCPIPRQHPQRHPKETADMTNPRFETDNTPQLPTRLSELLPLQGSLEVQRDQAGKTHNWHRHSLDEDLFVIEGAVTLFWHDGTARHERHCGVGTWISLPAGTIHGSTAGAAGAVYLIRPEGGQTADTVFLAAEEFPAA